MLESAPPPKSSHQKVSLDARVTKIMIKNDDVRRCLKVPNNRLSLLAALGESAPCGRVTKRQVGNWSHGMGCHLGIEKDYEKDDTTCG